MIPAWGMHARLFLEDAVESVRRQEPSPAVLIVDNAAEPALVAPLGVDVVRSDERLTVGGARNLGLDKVATPYVMFWDADDQMLPGTIDALRRLLDAGPDVVVAASRILEDDGTDHGWPRRRLAPLARVPRLWALLHAVTSLFPTTGAVLVRTDVMRDAGGFPDVDGGDDWAAGLALALRGRIALSDHPGRVYRRHDGSISDAWVRANHVGHARTVRRMLRHDVAAGPFRHAAVPVVAAGQLVVGGVLRPLRRRLRPRLRERLAARAPAGV